jgi:limonene-1,2-epoxide hydrolase
MFNRRVVVIACVGMFAAFSMGARAGELKESALEAWLQKYGSAWMTLDPAAAGALFTADATYQDVPFDPAMRGRAAIEKYWRTETADQRDVHFESQSIAVKGRTGVAHWSASFSLKSSGATVVLDGIFVLEFDDAGQCRSLREWWQVKKG